MAIHKRFPGSHPPRTYCGLPITQTDVRVAGGIERVNCRDCRRLSGDPRPTASAPAVRAHHHEARL